jgi:arylsulfatase
MTYNIVFIMPDQLRADFVGCYGADFVDTPHIDRLAEQGVRYQHAISPSPLCVPARASLLTGRNAIRNGVLDNLHWLRPDNGEMGITTWAEDLQGAGYQTAAIGKMHFYPWDASEGFEHRIIAEDKRHIGLQDDYADYLETQGLRKLHGNEHDGYHENKGAVISRIPFGHQVDRWVADETVKHIENYDSDAPFAIMVGLPSPHCPYDPTESYAERYEPDDMPDSIPETADSRAFKDALVTSNKRSWNGVDYSYFTESQKKKVRAHYAGLVTIVDDCVGQIIAGLKSTGHFDNTVIIFTSDHGDFVGDYGFVGKDLFYEPAIRVPMIMSHPENRQASVIDSPVSLTDISATIRQIAGVDFPTNNDSIPLAAVPNHDNSIREWVFGALAKGFMLTTSDWKLCRYHNGQTALYHISEDPHEQYNLAHEPVHLSKLMELDGILQREIIDSIQDGASDKHVKPQVLASTSTSSQRNWQRPYPASCTDK